MAGRVLDERVDRGGAHLPAGHPDGAQRRIGDGGELDVVPAHHAQVAGHGEAGPAQCGEHADGHHVVVDEHRGDLGDEHRLRGGAPALDGGREVADVDDLEVELVGGAGDGAAAPALGPAAGGAAGHADPAVLERAEVAQRPAHPGEGVGGDGLEVGVGAVDQGDPGEPGGGVEVRVAHPRGAQQHAVDLRGEGPHERQLPRGGLLRVGQQELHTVVVGALLGTLEQGGVEGVQQVRDDHAEHAGAAGDEGAGAAVGGVAELVDGLPYPLAGARADHGGLLQGAGGGGHGDLRPGRDVAQGDRHRASSWIGDPPPSTPVGVAVHPVRAAGPAPSPGREDHGAGRMPIMQPIAFHERRGP